MTDPVSWLQIVQGWSVVTADGVRVGTVAQIEGDKNSDIFDGLAVEPTGSAPIRFVAADKVAVISPGEVALALDAAEFGRLESFREPPPVTTWRPEKPSLMARISSWFHGGR